MELLTKIEKTFDEPKKIDARFPPDSPILREDMQLFLAQWAPMAGYYIAGAYLLIGLSFFLGQYLAGILWNFVGEGRFRRGIWDILLPLIACPFVVQSMAGTPKLPSVAYFALSGLAGFVLTAVCLICGNLVWGTLKRN
jgi:hypothetical protein